MSTTAEAATLCAAALLMAFACSYGNQVPEDSDLCLKVNQTKIFCLYDSSSSSTNYSLPLSCPVGFNVLIFSASVVQSPAVADGGSECPSEPHPEDIRCFELTSRRFQCPGNRCNIIVPISDDDDLCAQGQGQGTRYAEVLYRCQPVFDQFSNATATAIALDSDVVVSNSLIAINNDALGLAGVFTPSQTPFFCSGVLPVGTEVAISAPFMAVRAAEGDQETLRVCVDVDVLDADDNPEDLYGYSFCSDQTAPFVVLGCSSVERYVKVKYNSSSNANATVVFALNLQVSYLSKITMQCRDPVFPLIVPTTSGDGATSKSETPAASKTDGPPDIEKPENEPSTKSPNAAGFPLTVIVAVACGVGGLFLLVIIVVIVVVVWHRSKSCSVHHRPLSETSSIRSTISSDMKQELSLQIETDSKPEIIKE